MLTQQNKWDIILRRNICLYCSAVKIKRALCVDCKESYPGCLWNQIPYCEMQPCVPDSTGIVYACSKPRVYNCQSVREISMLDQHMSSLCSGICYYASFRSLPCDQGLKGQSLRTNQLSDFPPLWKEGHEGFSLCDLQQKYTGVNGLWKLKRGWQTAGY